MYGPRAAGSVLSECTILSIWLRKYMFVFSSNGSSLFVLRCGVKVEACFARLLRSECGRCVYALTGLLNLEQDRRDDDSAG